MVPSELTLAPTRETLISDHDIRRMQDGTYYNAYQKASELAESQHHGNTLQPNELVFLSLMTPDEREAYREKLSLTQEASPSALTQIDYGQTATRTFVREDRLAYYIGEKQRDGGVLTASEGDFLQKAGAYAQSLFNEASGITILQARETKVVSATPESPDEKGQTAGADIDSPSTTNGGTTTIPQPTVEPSKDPDFIIVGKTAPTPEGHYSEFRLQAGEGGGGPEGGTKPPGHTEKDEQLVAGYIKATEWMIALPGEYEHLRQYLENDGFLSDTELASALFDARLTREELQERIDRFESQATPEQREQITNYFWDVHGSVLDSPLNELIDPTATYRLVAAEVAGQTLPDPKKLNALKEEQESGQQQKKNPSLLELQFLSGGMVANFINNKRIVEGLLSAKKEGQQIIMNPQTTSTAKSDLTADRWDYKQVADQLGPLGIGTDQLQTNGNLEALLNGRKTALMRFEKEGEDGTKFPIEGKLYIAEVAGQGPTVHILQKLQTFTPPKFFLGYELTEADKGELTKTGNLNKVVEMRDRLTGEPFQGNIGVDPDTNRLTPARLDRFAIPTVIHGVTLSAEQRDSLRSGRPTRIDGMVNQKTGKGPFDALVTMNAFERKFKVQEIPGESQRPVAEQANGISNPNSFKIPDEIYGLRLTPEQKKALEQGDKVQLTGMIHPATNELVDARIQVRGLPPALQLDDIKRSKQQPDKVAELAQKPQPVAEQIGTPVVKAKEGTKKTSKTAVSVRQGGGVVDISVDTSTKKSQTPGTKTEVPKPQATRITDVQGNKPRAKPKVAKPKKSAGVKIR